VRAVDAVQGALFAVAVASLGSAGLMVLDARLYDLRQRQEAREWSRGGSAGEGPLRGSYARRRAARGQSWGRLESAERGLSAPLIEGIEARALRHAVGHVPGTAFPGEPGNVVLAGHRDMHFRPLREMKADDVIQLTTPDGTFDYRVVGLEVVGPQDTEVMAPTRGPQLTLITCYPFQYIGPAPYRYVVRAEPVGRPEDR
jgi:sortase A